MPVRLPPPIPRASTLLGGEYPKTWNAFIGQDQAKAQLRTAARAAKMREEPLPHCLIESGVPGIGKTSLALLTAAEMGTGARVVSGKMNVHDARMTFAEMRDRDVLIVDEAHQMVDGGKASAEWTLHYLQDGKLVTPLGVEDMPKVTLIFCTTEAGRLPDTILSRFRLRPQLVAYTEDEAAVIAKGIAQRVLKGEGLPMPSPENLRQVARAASHQPRLMIAVLESVRDIALVENLSNYSKRQYDLSTTLQWLGLTEDGLTQTACRLMVVLLCDFGGQPAGVAALQDRLQEPGGLAYTERLLMDKGLLAKGPGGRTLTTEGIRRARELALVAA